MKPPNLQFGGSSHNFDKRELIIITAGIDSCFEMDKDYRCEAYDDIGNMICSFDADHNELMDCVVIL